MRRRVAAKLRGSNIENCYCAKMEFVLEWTVAKRRSLQQHKECEMREFFLSIVLGVVLGAVLGGVAIGIFGLLIAGLKGESTGSSWVPRWGQWRASLRPICFPP